MLHAAQQIEPPDAPSLPLPVAAATTPLLPAAAAAACTAGASMGGGTGLAALHPLSDAAAGTMPAGASTLEGQQGMGAPDEACIDEIDGQSNQDLRASQLALPERQQQQEQQQHQRQRAVRDETAEVQRKRARLA